MSSRIIRVLCLFDYACTTGFSTVSHNIVNQLRRHFRDQLYLEIVAINYYGDPFYEDKNTHVLPAQKIDGKQDIYGRNEFMRIARYNDYDILFVIQDIAHLCLLGELYKLIKADRKKENRKQAKFIGYFPIDSPPLEGFLTHLDAFDTLVTYTEYGRKEMHKLRPEWKTKIKVIPHGINPDNFYPVSQDKKERFRRDYFGVNANKHIVTSVNRNQPRKDIPNTIFAFMEYKKLFENNCFLYLHMNPADTMGWNLHTIMEQSGLVPNVDYAFLSEEIQDHGASVDMLNYIYNASDVFVTTTLGEGWGLTVTEAFRCKLPVIAPLHTSLSEIGNYGQNLWGCSEFLPVCTTWDNIIRQRVDYREIAETIHNCKTDTKTTLDKIEKAYKYISSLTWENVCKRWIEEFKTLI